mgnify:CR=1 FL=1
MKEYHILRKNKKLLPKRLENHEELNEREPTIFTFCCHFVLSP